jgi:YD repeat-containing protein
MITLTTQTDALNRTTTNTYDNMSHLIQTIDPAGHITQYHYDDLDRLISVIDPANVQSTQGFDANGNQTDFTYDSADRLTAATLESGSQVSWSYNSLGLLGQEDPAGNYRSYHFDRRGYHCPDRAERRYHRYIPIRPLRRTGEPHRLNRQPPSSITNRTG